MMCQGVLQGLVGFQSIFLRINYHYIKSWPLKTQNGNPVVPAHLFTQILMPSKE